MKNKKIYSIKKRLTFSLIGLSVFFLIISIYYSYQASHHEIYEVYDARLGQTAKILLLTLPDQAQTTLSSRGENQLGGWLNEITRQAHHGAEATAYGHPYERNTLIQLYSHHHLLWSSQPEIKAVSVQPGFSGFGYVTIAGERWRFFQLPLHHSPRLQDNRDEHIFVAEKESIREEMMYDLALSSLIPQLVLIVCIAGMMLVLINRYFRPIKELQAAITQRSIHKLDVISVAQPTEELSPLVEALNGLLMKLDEAWKREKRFTRTAAHELKTPLAVLRINTENALKSRNQQELEQDLKQVLRGIERSDRLIQQLLTLARVESIHEMAFEQVNLHKLLQEMLSDLVPLALKRHQDLSLEGDVIWVAGDESLLRILFRNLVENAIRYSGEHSHIAVSMTEDVHDAHILVTDTGPDLTPEARTKLFETFYRSNPETGDGAGLGLAITRDIALLHRGQVRLLPRATDKNTFFVSLPLV